MLRAVSGLLVPWLQAKEATLLMRATPDRDRPRPGASAVTLPRGTASLTRTGDAYFKGGRLPGAALTSPEAAGPA